MVENNNIKIVHLFESYSDFYQPYIPPVIESLKKVEGLKITINAFHGKSENGMTVFPKYYSRMFKEKLYGLTHKSHPKLNYAEICFLQNKVDIVHIQHSYLFPKIIGLLNLPINDRPKIVITLRGGDTYVKPWLNKKWSNFYKNYGNKVEAFITMSEHQKNYLYTKWGIGKERIHVIPISFGSKFQISSKFPDSNKIRIVSIFRMCWEKNIDGNLRVIKYLYEKGLPIEYHIYGDGPDTGQLLFLIDKYNLTSCVKYYGKVENSLIKQQFSHYDFLLQLSHSESFGGSIIEAQSFGLPAIVTVNSGAAEAIVPNVSGYCIDANESLKGANHIESLWKQPELFNKFSKEAINFAQSNFATENEVERLTNLYLKMECGL